MRRLSNHISRLKRCESGAPVVEFAMVLPVLLLLFAVIIEGSRLTWIHQATSAGVRDASRMIARIAPLEMCTDPSPPVTAASFDSDATDIVRFQLGGTTSSLPSGMTLVDVSTTCIERTGPYRLGATSVVEVTAEIQINFILGNFFDFFGDGLGQVTTEISDQSRVYGV